MPSAWISPYIGGAKHMRESRGRSKSPCISPQKIPENISRFSAVINFLIIFFILLLLTKNFVQFRGKDKSE